MRDCKKYKKLKSAKKKWKKGKFGIAEITSPLLLCLHLLFNLLIRLCLVDFHRWQVT